MTTVADTPNQQNAVTLGFEPVELAFASAILVVHDDPRPFPTTMVDAAPDELGVVVVASDSSLSWWVREWSRHHSALPARLTIIDVGGAFGRGPIVEEMARESNVTVQTVPTPGDLVGQGIAIGQAVTEFDADGLLPLVVFPSLTQSLQYVSTDSLFRFLDVLRVRLQDAGAVGIYYMDEDAHDRALQVTLSSACDAFVSKVSGVYYPRT